MYLERKLKPDYSLAGLVPAIFSLVVFFVCLIFFGREIAFKSIAFVIFIYSLLTFNTFNQTKNFGYFVSGLYVLTLSLLFYMVPQTKGRWPHLYDAPELFKFFLFIIYFLIVLLIYFLATRKIKWRGREIFELAAEKIEEKPGSFTDRPMFIGKADYTKDELRRFVLFVRKNLICMTYEERERILFVPVVMGDYAPLYQPNFNYLVRTWIACDYDGNLSVHISQRDYLNYKDALSFDLLCNSLGSLFIEFLEMFLRGEGSRIIDRMNTLKINVFT